MALVLLHFMISFPFRRSLLLENSWLVKIGKYHGQAFCLDVTLILAVTQCHYIYIIIKIVYYKILFHNMIYLYLYVHVVTPGE